MRRTILVVDDMPIIRDPIASTLSAAGYRALRAGNGKEALAALELEPVDLILLDVHMPVMDGLAFLGVLRQRPATASIPVIMLSGAEDREDVLEAAKLGARGYVLKSHFSLRDLLARVTQHFNSLTPVAPPVAAPQPVPARSPSPDVESEVPCAVTAAPSHRQQADRSGVLANVISMADSPRGNVSDLAALIARDPLLSAQILEAANSPTYTSLRGSVSELPDALRILGSSAVKKIVHALAAAA